MHDAAANRLLAGTGSRRKGTDGNTMNTRWPFLTQQFFSFVVKQSILAILSKTLPEKTFVKEPEPEFDMKQAQWPSLAEANPAPRPSFRGHSQKSVYLLNGARDRVQDFGWSDYYSTFYPASQPDDASSNLASALYSALVSIVCCLKGHI